jgi:hypothetical protein
VLHVYGEITALLQVVELRQELEARGLDKKGVKNVLATRLQEAIDKEKASAQDTSALSTNASIAETSESAETVPAEVFTFLLISLER